MPRHPVLLGYDTPSDSESESGSGGNEYARARPPGQALVRAEPEVKASGQAPAEGLAVWPWEAGVDEVGGYGRIRARAEELRAKKRAEAEARAVWRSPWEADDWEGADEVWSSAAWEGGDASARVQAELKMVERAEEARARATKVWALARAEAKAQVEVWARARAQGPAKALVRALAQTRERVMDEVGLSLEEAIELVAEPQNEWWWIEFLQHSPTLPQPSHAPTFAEVLADSKIKDILDSITPQYRHELTHHLWQHSEHSWLIQIFTPITRLPLELFQQIFSTIINDASGPPLMLMLVCKHWHTTVTGIWASLKLGTRTPRDAVARKLERNQWLLDIVVDTEIDRGYLSPSRATYGGIFAAIEATSRWRSLVVETFPRQADLPEHLVDRGLQRYSNAAMSRLRLFKIKHACEMSPLLERLLRILGTTASPELSTVEINSANVISFLVPTYSPFFRSVKVLFLDISGRHDSVDLLPHLHQLETLTASHLSLPTYGYDIELPFVNTLRHLTLRAVSIQWMSGRTFEVLESCIITFPPHRHTLPIVGTTLPNCKQFTFQGNPLDVLDGISAHKLIQLSVTCSASFNRRGTQQLVGFSSQALRESRLAPRILHITIEATNRAWINALAFMSDLEELVIGSARPSSLGVKVLQSLIVKSVHASNTGAASTTKGWHPPLCPSLKRFGLKYRRWLRSSEHFDMALVAASIIWSRGRSNRALQSFHVWRKCDKEAPLELVGIFFKDWRQ